MPDYKQYSREELIQRIEDLEKQVKLEVSFKEKHSTEILDILPDMLSVFDHNYNYVALASSEKTVHVGGSSENLVGKNLIDILPPGAYEAVKDNFDKVISTGEASIGYHNLYVEGELENFENRVIPLDDHQHILCICRNITEKVKAQNRLQMVISAVNNSIEEIYAVRADGNLMFANKQFKNHYHLTDEVTNYKIYDIFEEKSISQWNEYVNTLKECGGARKYTSSYIQDGQEHFEEITAFILKDNFEQEIIWSISRDNTEQLKQENKIRELNQLMETILNNIPVYLFVKDTGNEFRYLYWNKEFEKMSSIPASFAIGKTDAEVFPNKKDAEKFRKDDLQLLRDNHTVNFEEDYTTATGEKRIVHTIKTLIPLENKKPLLIGISWDITEQKITEQELIKARMKAEEADKLKSAFLANMSHEIRTPLNAIVGFSKLIAETDEPEARLQYADIVDKNTDLLLQLINDILDLSRIEAGMLKFVEKPIELNALCQSIYETLLPRTPENVTLIYDKKEQDISLLTDGNRLAQVLSNLLNNAQKFTYSGEIRFGFILKEKQIEFYVKDTGMGIAPENLDKIFNRFIKLNNFIQGTGLGLPICRMIIENLGGEIQVKSVLDQGTEFRFTLPRKSGEIIPSLSSCKRTNRQATILIAEDVENNFILLQTLLGKNYRLFHAHNGREALEIYEKETPDLILMETRMPDLDGLAATRLIRAQSKTIPIIALATFACEADKEPALQAGCNDFLVKPLSAPSLQQVIEKYI